MVLPLPIIDAPSADGPPSAQKKEPVERLPRWLKRQLPSGNGNHFTSRVLEALQLETVCENAKCPNRMECYSQSTATFMILGAICTRPCGFCSVQRGRPDTIEQDEPERIAEGVVQLGLKHVVITSVTRDDLPDGGAEHFVRCIDAIRSRSTATLEVLTPDFLHNPEAVKRIAAARPDVFNHNTETVPRLYRKVRGPKSDYRWTLDLLQMIKECSPSTKTKSGLMLGLGESHDEVFDVFADLLDAKTDFLTLGQYLRPGDKYLPVERYLPPEEFSDLGKRAEAIGFSQVASGPFVRSSYHARAMAESP